MTTTTAERICLNLGCGNKFFRAEDVKWINVDFPGNSFNCKPDIEADIRQLPFPDDYADEIHAIHVIEHIHTWEVEDLLKEWKRVLKPGGWMAIECPDLNKILRLLINRERNPAKTLLGLYGAQDSKDPNMVHKWCYTWLMLRDLLEGIGFQNVSEKPCQWHIPKRDIRVECRKP